MNGEDVIWLRALGFFLALGVIGTVITIIRASNKRWKAADATRTDDAVPKTRPEVGEVFAFPDHAPYPTTAHVTELAPDNRPFVYCTLSVQRPKGSHLMHIEYTYLPDLPDWPNGFVITFRWDNGDTVTPRWSWGVYGDGPGMYLLVTNVSTHQ